jgi:hypothetical protein
MFAMYKNKLKEISQSKYAAIIAAMVVLTIFIVTTIILFKFADIERQRDLINWETRLNIVADSRADAVNEWIDRQFSELDALAHNQSLQLYSSQITQTTTPPKEDPFQVSYLRNLLISTAERSGFSGIAEQQVSANIPFESTSGLAILDKDKKILVSTSTMPPLEGKLAELIANLPRREHYVSNIYKGVEDKPTVLFSVPIAPIQAEGDDKIYVGNVVGIRTVENSLFPLLKQPGDTGKSSEAMLVRVDGGVMNYLSPTKDGSPALSKNLNITDELEADFAAVNPGKFAIKRDYTFNKVLVTGRKIANTQWTLVYKIDRDEALAESDTHTNNLLTIGIMAIFFITAAIIAMWQYVNFLKESRVAARYRKMMLDLKSQKHILRLITDNKPEVTFIVDGKNRYRFANLKAAEQARMYAKDMIGQTIVHVMGKEKAMHYIKINASVMADKKTIVNVQNISVNGQERIIQSSHIPLPHIPSPDDGKYRDGVLVIEHDITAPIKDKEKVVRTRDALIDTLVSFLDKRDHYTADHSARVARLADAIALEIGVDEITRQTVSIAGKLMNLGRALIPLNLLTKTEELTAQEREIFENTTSTTSELLEGIEFEGPVVQTINQSNERFDGSGRLGLTGDDILISARIIAVANAFVGMCSPRAYRLKKTVDESVKSISAEMGTKFDRGVVAALINYMENRGGRAQWNKE